MNWRHHKLPVLDGAPIEAYRLTAAEPGPTLAILGGVHGDEPEGVFAVTTLVETDLQLLRGAIVAVPVAHPAAFAADARAAPDGGNLARAFPGSLNGSPVERVAAVLSSEILSRADVLIDLHTAGRDYDMPMMAGYIDTDDEAAAMARHLAEQFGADFLWRHPHGNPGRSLSVMVGRGKPAIYVEAPGGGTLTKATVDRYVEGVQRCAIALAMIEADFPPHPARHDVTGPGNLDADVLVAPDAGYFTALVDAGDSVNCGQSLGLIMKLGGGPERIVSPQDGVVMYLRRRARVEAGVPLACLAHGDRDEATRSRAPATEAVR
ncbi:MAG: hypothetical protein GY798_14515 [Hyphomicrobiales bacterium]|nr:hypothetical protein [Hyphomicrobiales bacterium]